MMLSPQTMIYFFSLSVLPMSKLISLVFIASWMAIDKKKTEFSKINVVYLAPGYGNNLTTATLSH